MTETIPSDELLHEAIASGQIGHHRARALAYIRQRKLDDAFEGRKFDVEREVHLSEGEAFRTLLGNTGRHGWVIRDRDSGTRYVVTKYLMRLLVDSYGAVEQMPDTRPRLTG